MGLFGRKPTENAIKLGLSFILFHINKLIIFGKGVVSLMFWAMWNKTKFKNIWHLKFESVALFFKFNY